MTTEDWKWCAEHGVVIAPMLLYTDYREGNFHKDDLLGLRFVVFLHVDLSTAATDPIWSQIDQQQEKNFFETPEEALAWAKMKIEGEPKR